MAIKLTKTGNRSTSWPLPQGYIPESRTSYQIELDGRSVGLVSGVDVLFSGRRSEHPERSWWLSDLEGKPLSGFHRHNNPPGAYFDTRDAALVSFIIWYKDRH